MSYMLTSEPVVGSIPHFEIRLNGKAIACARDYVSAGMVLLAVEAELWFIATDRSSYSLDCQTNESGDEGSCDFSGPTPDVAE